MRFAFGRARVTHGDKVLTQHLSKVAKMALVVSVPGPESLPEALGSVATAVEAVSLKEDAMVSVSDTELARRAGATSTRPCQVSA